MKHQGYIDIDRSIELVTKIFADPQYLGEYQDGFIKKVLVSGEPGQTGSVSKMYYENRKHKMELTETIISNQLPDLFEASFYHIHMDNTMKCKFKALSPNQTRYQYTYEYTRINWLMPRLMAILFPSMYKRPAEKWLRQFKEFVEAFE